jgi:hypothetical protein
MRKISYEKLSQLQKLILVALSAPRYAVMKRRAFKRHYYGKDSHAATSSLSRAYQRLEGGRYIARSGGRWTLGANKNDERGYRPDKRDRPVCLLSCPRVGSLESESSSDVL